MIAKYTKFVVFLLTILAAMVLSEYVEGIFDKGNSYKGIAIKMAVTVFVYIPVFGILEQYLAKVSKKYASKSKQIAKNNFLGLTIGFIIALLGLYWLLINILTGKNALDLII